jgi:AcrR family transcriptional regulator
MGRKKQLSDADLLSFARAAFIREGLSAPTRGIAGAAGVSEAVLFQRYRTKAELFLAAMVPPPIELDQLFLASDADLRTQLKAVFDALIDYFRAAHPILVQLSVRPDSSVVAMFRQMFEQLNRFLHDRLDPDQEPGGAALLLITSAHSIASLEAMGFEAIVVDSVFESIWRGMKPNADGTRAKGERSRNPPSWPGTTSEP